MNRSDGLVQRRNVIRDNSEGGTKDRDSHRGGNDKDDDADDGDSKGTRLTLMEEVLLLGLKEKEVITFINTTVYTSWNMCSVTSHFLVHIFMLGTLSHALRKYQWSVFLSCQLSSCNDEGSWGCNILILELILGSMSLNHRL